MLLRMKTVTAFKSATCLIGSCANCFLMSGYDDAAKAAVMGASAPEKSAIIGKAPSNRNVPLLLSPTPRATITAGDLQPEIPNTATKFQGRVHCDLELSQPWPPLLSSPYVAGGSGAVSSCMLRAQ
jgi:hypothetical protein